MVESSTPFCSDDDEAICGYCSTRFVYDDAIPGVCAPPECELVDA